MMQREFSMHLSAFRNSLKVWMISALMRTAIILAISGLPNAIVDHPRLVRNPSCDMTPTSLVDD